MRSFFPPVRMIDSMEPLPNPAPSYSTAQVLKLAPEFTAHCYFEKEFKKVRLSDYYGQYLVIFFYPRDFGLVCPTEVVAFSEEIEKFKKLKCALLGVSTDSKFAHMQASNTPREKGGLGDINFPLISDATLTMSTEYGCLIDEEERETLR